MGLINRAADKVRKEVQDFKDTKILAPDGTWVRGRKEYKAAAERAKKGGK